MRMAKLENGEFISDFLGHPIKAKFDHHGVAVEIVPVYRIAPSYWARYDDFWQMDESHLPDEFWYKSYQDNTSMGIGKKSSYFRFALVPAEYVLPTPEIESAESNPEWGELGY